MLFLTFFCVFSTKMEPIQNPVQLGLFFFFFFFTITYIVGGFSAAAGAGT